MNTTETRYTDTGRATLVPLLVDVETGRIRNLDLEVTPHLLVSGYTGFGATSALRLLAVHAARNGMDVQIVDRCPKRSAFTGLEGVQGVTVHRDADAIAQAVFRYTADMEAALHALDGADVSTRRLLVVDGVNYLKKVVVGHGSARMSALDALENVVFLGRAAGYHFAASVPQTAVHGLPRGFQDCSAVLNLGPTGNRVRQQLMGAEARTPGVPAGRGGGEFADYDGPRPVRTVFVDEHQARQLVTR